jgi:hypothetical protein
VRKYSLLPGILVALALVSAFVDRAAGATGPIDYSNKTWNLDGSVKSRAKGSGSQTTKGELSVAFDDANFILTDAQGDVLQGSYLSDAKGKAVLTPDNESLQAYVATKVEKGFASAGVTATVGEVTITDVKATTKATSIATGLLMVLGIKIKANADVTIGVDTGNLDVTVQDKGKGVLITPVGGTSWVIPLATKLSLKGLGSDKGEDTLQLRFGPNAGEGLGEGEFKGSFAGGDELVGTFTTDGKQKVFLHATDGTFEGLHTAITNLVESRTGGTLTNLVLENLDGTVKVKVIHGLAIAFALKLKFDASGDVDGVPHGSSGSYQAKGKGTPD